MQKLERHASPMRTDEPQNTRWGVNILDMHAQISILGHTPDRCVVDRGRQSDYARLTKFHENNFGEYVFTGKYWVHCV